MFAWQRWLFAATMFVLPVAGLWVVLWWGDLSSNFPEIVLNPSLGTNDVPGTLNARGIIAGFWAIGLLAILRLDQYFHTWFAVAPDCTGPVRKLFEAIARDERFLIRAGLWDSTGEDTPVEALEVTPPPQPGHAGENTAAEAGKVFHTILQKATILHSPSLQGGYAGLGCEEGRLPDERPIVLALSPSSLRIAAAAHELFHLSRHVRGVTRFEDEKKMNFFAIGWEEAKVWLLTVRYVPLRSSLELIRILTTRLGLLVALAAYLNLRFFFPSKFW
jgi:hypothetical protein